MSSLIKYNVYVILLIMKSFKQFKKESLTDPEVKRAYNEQDIGFQLLRLLIKERIRLGITQAELAKSIGTKQSAIARFEAGNSNPTLDFIQKLSSALNVKLRIS